MLGQRSAKRTAFTGYVSLNHWAAGAAVKVLARVYIYAARSKLNRAGLTAQVEF